MTTKITANTTAGCGDTRDESGPWPPARLSLNLVHRPLRTHTRVELDLAEGGLVSRNVLLQESKQRFGLLRAQVNALHITNLHMRFGLLLEGSEDQKEVPDIHTHLHAVGVILAVIGVVH